MQETIELRRVLPETDHLPISRVGPRARYFYFFMALLVASVVVFGFGQTVGPRFLHTPYHKPLVLTVHAAVFSAWILFYLLQSGLVRAGNVRIHRLLGLFGAAFGIAIPAIGTITAVVMRRFDLQHPDLAVGAPTLRTALLDLGTFAIPFTLAIYWRNKPEFHRRLIIIVESLSRTDRRRNGPFGHERVIRNPCWGAGLAAIRGSKSSGGESLDCILHAMMALCMHECTDYHP